MALHAQLLLFGRIQLKSSLMADWMFISSMVRQSSIGSVRSLISRRNPAGIFPVLTACAA
jgi:hypothetical protein